jgi:hypothetical protein
VKAIVVLQEHLLIRLANIISVLRAACSSYNNQLKAYLSNKQVIGSRKFQHFNASRIIGAHLNPRPSLRHIVERDTLFCTLLRYIFFVLVIFLSSNAQQKEEIKNTYDN